MCAYTYICKYTMGGRSRVVIKYYVYRKLAEMKSERNREKTLLPRKIKPDGFAIWKIWMVKMSI